MWFCGYDIYKTGHTCNLGFPIVVILLSHSVYSAVIFKKKYNLGKFCALKAKLKAVFHLSKDQNCKYQTDTHFYSNICYNC